VIKLFESKYYAIYDMILTSNPKQSYLIVAFVIKPEQGTNTESYSAKVYKSNTTNPYLEDVSE